MRQLFALMVLLAIVSFEALALDAFVRHARFYAPKSGPYIETYITIPTSNLQFSETNDGKLQAGVEITILYKQNNEIVKFDKYILNSKAFKTEDEIEESLLDVKRTALKANTYQIEVAFKDVNDKKAEVLETKSSIDLKDAKDEVAISDIQLLENYEKSSAENSFVKNGFMMLPHCINYYPTQMSKLMYYFEVYNTHTLNDEEYLISQSINYYNSDKVYKNIKQFAKKKSKVVEVSLAEFDISKLPSGNYDLTIQVINKSNEVLLEKKQFIQRLNLDYVESEDDLLAIQTNNTFANDLSDEDALYQIRTLYPISSRSEVRLANSIFKEKKVDLAKQFLLNFFTKRNGANPGEPYENYMNAVNAVNNTFGNQIDEGFETEIGRVYLQYGEPSSIIKDQTKSGLDFQLWHYYALPDGQSNITFLFFKSGLTFGDQSGAAFELFHTDALKEPQYGTWTAAKSRLEEGFGDRFDTDEFDKLYQYMGETGRIRGKSDDDSDVNPFE